MSANQFIPASVNNFVVEVINRETDVQKRLRVETAKMPLHQMQISADEGAFLAFLIKMTGARQVLEIGTFTGYSALSMAMALPENGTLIACDASKEWTDIAQRYWREARVSHKIELCLGHAMETLNGLLAEGRTECFDLAFIDADKINYDAYYEACLKLVKVGGVIVLDNMLWSGTVADETEQDIQTSTLRMLNLKLRDDPRVDISLLTVADGVMLVRKRR